MKKTFTAFVAVATIAGSLTTTPAIASRPSLRAPEGLRASVSINAILEALCALGDEPRHAPGGKPMRLRSVEGRAAA
jgi:hypothetical protein